jgi:type VI secretion system secreted protein VgrG
MTNKLPHGEVLTLKLLDNFADSKVYGKLVSIEGYEAFSEPFTYQLNLITANKSIMDKIKCNIDISFAIEFLVGNEIKYDRVLNGVVKTATFKKRHKPQNLANPEYEYSLFVVPKLAALKKVKHSRVFYKEKQEVVEIIKRVLDDHKIDHDLKVKDKTIFIAETCIQYDETDYSFILRLIQSIGCFYYFKHEKGKHVMIITNQQSQYTDLPEKSVKYIDEGGQVLGLDDLSLSYSNHSTDFVVNAFSYANYETTIEKSYSNVAHKKQEGQLLQSERNSYLCNIHNADQVTKLAENLGKIQQLSAEYLNGQSRYITFTTGGKFVLEGNFFKEFQNKDYVISKLSFTANCDNGHDYTNNFTSIPSNRTFISSEIIDKPVISGLHFALIVNSDGKASDQEPCGDDKGNVYIKLLWGEKNSICKASVLSVSNSYTIPRVGSLVYVLFPNNNLYNDMPVVVGMHNEGLLNFNDKNEFYKNIYMSYPASSNKEIYNSIFFTDKKEEQKINIEAKKDFLLNVEHDEINVIKNNSTSTVKNIRKAIIEEGNDILDVNKGDIIIEAKEGQYQLTTKANIVINSAKDIAIISKADLSIKSGGKITMESKDGLFIKTDGEYKSQSAKNTSIEASSELNLSGQKVNSKAKTSANYESGTATTIKSGTSTDIKSATTLKIESVSSELKGKANLKVSSPMTKIGM